MQVELFTRQNHFHNSLPESDEKQLSIYESKAKKQDELILQYIRKTKKSFTPWELYNVFGHQIMKSSVQRSLTNLTKAGKAFVTGERRMGQFDRETNCWRAL